MLARHLVLSRKINFSHGPECCSKELQTYMYIWSRYQARFKIYNVGFGYVSIQYQPETQSVIKRLAFNPCMNSGCFKDLIIKKNIFLGKKISYLSFSQPNKRASSITCFKIPFWGMFCFWGCYFVLLPSHLFNKLPANPRASSFL